MRTMLIFFMLLMPTLAFAEKSMIEQLEDAVKQETEEAPWYEKAYKAGEEEFNKHLKSFNSWFGDTADKTTDAAQELTDKTTEAAQELLDSVK